LHVTIGRDGGQEADEWQLHGKDRIKIQAVGDMAVLACKEIEIEGVVQLLQAVAHAPDDTLQRHHQGAQIDGPLITLSLATLASNSKRRHLQFEKRSMTAMNH